MWLTGRSPRDSSLAATSGSAGGAPAPAGTPGWTPAAGQPLAASAGPQRLLGGDWNLPNPNVDRTLIKAAEPEPGPEAQPGREAHVIPQAPTLQLTPPLGLGGVSGVASTRASTAVAPPKPLAAAPPPVSTAPVQASIPPPATEQRHRRTLIPIPEPAKYGVTDARAARPVFKSEFPIPPGSNLQTPPNAIALDPDKAVLLVDKAGDGYLTPATVAQAKAAKLPQTDPRFIRVEGDKAVQAADVRTSSPTGRGRPPAPQ